MSDSNVIPFPTQCQEAPNPASNSVWVLFVMEDLRQHFLSTRNREASVAVEDTIQKLERFLM